MEKKAKASGGFQDTYTFDHGPLLGLDPPTVSELGLLTNRGEKERRLEWPC